MQRKWVLMLAAGAVIWMQLNAVLALLQMGPRTQWAVSALILLFQAVVLALAAHQSRRAGRWLLTAHIVLSLAAMAAHHTWRAVQHRVVAPSSNPDDLFLTAFMCVWICGLLVWLLSRTKQSGVSVAGTTQRSGRVTSTPPAPTED